MGQEPVDCFCSWFLWWYSAFHETVIAEGREASATTLTLLLLETLKELFAGCAGSSAPHEYGQIQLAK